MYPGVPALADAVADPSFPPKHKTSVDTADAVSSGGSEIFADVTTVHPLASVTVTEYVPAYNPFAMDAFPPAGDQL